MTGVLSALRMLMDREPCPSTLNFPVGTSQYPHSDGIHFHTVGRLYGRRLGRVRKN